jgi:exodeoxyribonuclease VII small subunit
MAGADGIPEDIAKLGFEEALKELETIVRTLESGDGKLDDAIVSYERGAALKKHCEGKLAEARNRIERISFADGNAATTESMDVG